MSTPTGTMKDLMVVGAGPVGLFTALLAAEGGLSVGIVDQDWRISGRSYACALHPHTLTLLGQLGLLDAAMERGVRVDTIAFYDGVDRRAQVHLRSMGLPHPFALVLYQEDLEGLLEDALRERHSVRVAWGRRLDALVWNEDSVTAVLDHLQHRSTGDSAKPWSPIVDKRDLVPSRFLVGADGSQSRVLHLLGTGSDQVGEPTAYRVYEFEPQIEGTTSREWRVALDGGMAHMLWPLPGGTCRWTLQQSQADPDSIEPGGESAPGPRLPQRIARVAPWFELGIKSMDWASRMEFPQRVVHQFGRGRCWVLGDAAHQTAPGGAQGMNLGIREAAEFVSLAKAILREGGPSGLLREASVRWHEEWVRLLGMSPSVEPTSRASRWVASHIPQIVSNLPASGAGLGALLDQLGLRWVAPPSA